MDAVPIANRQLTICDDRSLRSNRQSAGPLAFWAYLGALAVSRLDSHTATFVRGQSSPLQVTNEDATSPARLVTVQVRESQMRNASPQF